jgi:hypothetical protein
VGRHGELFGRQKKNLSWKWNKFCWTRWRLRNIDKMKVRQGEETFQESSGEGTGSRFFCGGDESICCLPVGLDRVAGCFLATYFLQVCVQRYSFLIPFILFTGRGILFFFSPHDIMTWADERETRLDFFFFSFGGTGV